MEARLGRSRSWRFLVVDPERASRIHTIVAIDQATGRAAEVVEAASAERAIQEFRAHRPGVVFFDLFTPVERGGPRVVEQMLAERPDAKIVITSALPLKHPGISKAIALGAFAVFPKPIYQTHVETLLSMIEQEARHVVRIA